MALFYKWQHNRRVSLGSSYRSVRRNPSTIPSASRETNTTVLRYRQQHPQKIPLFPAQVAFDYNLTQEALDEGLGNVLELGLELLAESTLLLNGGEELRLVGSEVGKEVSLPLENLADGDGVEETVDTGVDEGNHLVDGHGGVLLLLEELGQTLTTVESLLGGGIKIGTELSKGGDLTVLSQEKLEGTSDLLHGLELGSGTDTGDGKTDVDGRSDTLVEELSLQEDLTISDGNDVGGNVSGDITTLGLNDGKGSHGTTTVSLVVHLGGTLEETRVEVENVTGVSLTARGTSEKKGHLSVGDGLLGQIVVDDERVHSIVTEVLSN